MPPRTIRLLQSLSLAPVLAGCISLSQISEDVDGAAPILGEITQSIAKCFVSENLECGVAVPPYSEIERSWVNAPSLVSAGLPRDEITPPDLDAAADCISTLSSCGQQSRLTNLASILSDVDWRDAAAEAARLGTATETDVTALERANAVFASPVTADVLSAIIYSSGLPGPELKREVVLNRQAAAEWSGHLNYAIGNDGFARAQVYFASAALAGEDQDANANAWRAKIAALLKAYFKAYFRNGKFASVRFDAKDVEAEIKSRLDDSIPEDVEDREELIKKLTADLLKAALRSDPVDGTLYSLIGEISNAAFVTRGGASYSFPALTIDVNPLAENRIDSNEIDYGAVGADLVRVFVEAVGDAWGNVPADASSTALTNEDPLLPPVPMDAEDTFSKVNDVADRVEGTAGPAAGRLIRGVSWFALNNEALAKMFETLVAVSARKGTEKLAWCYFECTAESEAATEPRTVQPRELAISLSAPR